MGRVSLCYSIHDPHHQGSGRRISAAGQREKEAALAGAAEIVPQPAAGAVGDLLHRIVDADVEHRRLVHQRGGGGEPEIDLGGGKNVPMSSTDEYDLCTNGVPGTSRKSTWGEGCLGLYFAYVLARWRAEKNSAVVVTVWRIR